MGGVARPVVIGVGSNLGDRRGHVEHAILRLREAFGTGRVSTLVETDPVGVPTPQQRYLNGVALFDTSCAARDVLELLQRIEAECGRERPYVNAPRTLDLDLILCGDDVIDTPDLVVPHPRFRERTFVLAPLAEIAPDLMDPVTGLTVRQLLARLSP
jgi:2-amino-4-hydroxy-6-hydroxymethyldihydropteridine diphosphokinase